MFSGRRSVRSGTVMSSERHCSAIVHASSTGTFVNSDSTSKLTRVSVGSIRVLCSFCMKSAEFLT